VIAVAVACAAASTAAAASFDVIAHLQPCQLLYIVLTLWLLLLPLLLLLLLPCNSPTACTVAKWLAPFAAVAAADKS
jgi:hypothetical protein